LHKKSLSWIRKLTVATVCFIDRHKARKNMPILPDCPSSSFSPKKQALFNTNTKENKRESGRKTMTTRSRNHTRHKSQARKYERRQYEICQ
jgi:hypothetical protein